VDTYLIKGDFLLKLKYLSFLLAVLLTLNVFASTIVFAEDDTDFEPTIAALGDSIPYGTSLPDRSMAFPNLILDGRTHVINKSIPGLTSTGLLQQLTSDENAKSSLQSADVITLTIGSNDLLQAVDIKAIEAAIKAGETVDPELIKAAAAEAAKQLGVNLKNIISAIRLHNTAAPILLYNIYNPFPNLESDPVLATLHSLGEQILGPVNSTIFAPAAHAQGTFILDAYSVFNGKQAALVYPGDIHPQPAGHQGLAMLADLELANLLQPVVPVIKLEIELFAEPHEETDGPVTIHINTNDNDNLIAVMWLAGERNPEDFLVEEVNELETLYFEVTENGMYTVLVATEEQFATGTIEISNIIEASKEEPPSEEPTAEEPTAQEDPPPAEQEKETPPPPVKKEEMKKPEKKKTKTKTEKKGNKLPNTATAAYNYLLIGSVLLLSGIFGIAGLLLFKRKISLN
jgi:lysophospholipase L1-like esterase